MATDTEDHIFSEARTTRFHREHIILHEIAHMLLDHHHIGPSHGTGPLQHLFTDLDPETVRRLLARTNYISRQEQEAEMLASLIKTVVLRTEDDQQTEVLRKLSEALGVDA
ncbi:hypothetical protein [Streptomyces roseochromogenus]|uniref:IrrE N-terminal-like domain-containing protein n=1 Tax=Streptomyces roseochromogenus subsp. oscitans DS 12.976 TaxID=1352936 RepID=V6KQQ5_STRRC|nr:hypothetical protein [Streptomyces roseochromogenus]EST33756.1 hypothetical protein M878_11970 [Streptomyces roseochromogenus subsp. oscitans DS 12.976]